MNTRILPTRRNPHIAADESLPYDELVARRRLGRTKLTVKPGQVGTSSATKAENLGPVEYAHLRAPLPDNLEGSELFGEPDRQTQYPETYFLMRRSKDGYVSATGMFKVAFPWATKIEEREESDFLKSLDTTSEEEIAGNVWISPEHALELAEEYGLAIWIRALLDPTDIAQPPATGNKKLVTEPPKFTLPLDTSFKLAAPRDIKTPRGRSTRSMSPAKGLAPVTGTATKTKSPRKRQTKAQKEAIIAQANAASASLQSALDDAASIAETGAESEESNIEEAVAEAIVEAEAEIEAAAEEAEESETSPSSEKVKVAVEQAVELTNGTEITHTNVTVSMPVGLPDLPLPEDTESMLEKAKQMVEEAKALEASAPVVNKLVSKKRKADEVEPSDIDKELPVQPAKKARVLEEKLKRERVRTRALVGVGAMLGIAAAIPYFF